MVPYTIPLFLAILGIFFAMVYVYIKAKKTRVTISFIFFLFNVFLWLMGTFILHNIPVCPFTSFTLKTTSIFTFMVGFSVMNFVYALLNKKTDFIYWLLLFISFSFILLHNFTGIVIHFPSSKELSQLPSPTKFVNAFYYTSKPYGTLLLKFFFSFSVIVPILYSLYLVYKARKTEENINRKKQLSTFLIGATLTFFLGVLITLLIGRHFKPELLILLQVLAAISLIFFSFIGLKRFGFLVPSMETFSEELFNRAQDGIIILNPEERIININETAKKWLNLGEKSVDGLPITSVIEEYSTDKDKFDIRRGDTYFGIKKIPITEGDSLIGTIVIIVDMTEQKELQEELKLLNSELQEKVVERTLMLQRTVEELEEEMKARLEAEKELRETVNLYKTLFESGSDAIFLTDRKGNIIDANKKAQQMLEKPKEKIVRLNLFDYIKFYGGELKEIKEDMEEDKGVIIEGILRREDGTNIDIEANIKDVWISNKLDYLIFVRDITQRKEMERQSINMSKLESMSIFAGGVAHDFNNMLTAIFGNLSLIKLRVKEHPEVYKSIEKIETVLNEAKSLTSQLLSLSKGGEPIKEATTIKDLLIDTVTFVLRGSAVKPIFDIPDELSPVNIDKAQISRVIQNIVVNSMDAMPSGGVIRITVREEDVSPMKRKFIQGDRALKITIEDNGPGIPEDILPHIFDPFFTTKKKGSGLGLASAYSIVKRHGGCIEVRSAPGKGTIFYIYLPIIQKKLKPSSSPVQYLKEEEALKGAKILVMDDEKIIREFLEEALATQGYEVEFAETGEETIKKYIDEMKKGTPFDLVIIDLTIPGGMGGRETIEKLREIDPFVCAIVSSGYSDTDVMSRYREYGFVGYLHKPYSLSELFSIVNRAIKKRKEEGNG